MGEEQHTVETRVKYVAEDQASSTAHKIAKAFHESGEAFEKSKEHLREFRRETLTAVAGIAGFGFGIFSLVEHAKEANAELTGTQKAIAGTLSTVLEWDKGTSAVDKFNRSMVLSRGVTLELEEQAARFNMQLGDLGSAYKTMAVSLAPLHVSQKQLVQETILAAAAAKQFGIDGATAADRVGKAIVSKTIRASDDLGKFLYENVGGNLKKLNNAQVLERMNKALRQSEGIAEQMGQGMAGSITRIQMRFNEMFRDLTGPLFKEIASALDSVSKHIKSVGADGKPILEIYAHRLVDGFRKLREVTGYLVDHWKLIAIAIASIKLPAAMIQMSSMAGAISNAFRGIGTFGAVGGGAAGLGGFVGALGTATAGLMAFKIGLDAFLAWYDAKLDDRDREQLHASNIASAYGTASRLSALGVLSEQDLRRATKAVDEFKKAGVVNSAGLVDRGALERNVALMEGDQREAIARQIGMRYIPSGRSQTTPSELASAMLDQIGGLLSLARTPAPLPVDDRGRKTAGVVQHFHGDIINNMKFDDPDPDRVFVGWVGRLQNLAKRPTSSPYVDPFGD